MTAARQGTGRSTTRPAGRRSALTTKRGTGRSPHERLVRRATLTLIVLMLVGMVLAMAGTALAAPVSTAAAPTRTAPVPGDPTAARAATAPGGAARRGATGPHLVLIGTTSLTWADVVTSAQAGDPASARLLTMAAHGEPANLVQRTAGDVTCPADAWLSLSAGARTRATEPAGQEAATAPGAATPACPWPTWNQARAAASSSGYTATPGALAHALARAGQGVLAVGRGAELALTTPDGAAPATTATLADAVDAGLPDVTLVDAPSPADLAAALDALASLEDQGDVQVVVASLADPADPGLQMLLLPPGTRGWGDLSPVASPSTRQVGVVQLTDLAATILTSRGLAVPADMTGTALSLGAATPSAQAPGPTGDPTSTVPPKVTTLIDSAQRARASRAVALPVCAALVIVSVVVSAAGALALRGRGGPRRLRAVLTAALLAGWAPVGVWTSAIMPWWKLVGDGEPRTGLLVLAVLAASAVMTAAFVGTMAGMLWASGHIYRALVDRGLWPRPAGGIPAATSMMALIAPACVAILIITDAASGTQMGFAGATGMDPILAGRFYGLSNTAFAIAGPATLIFAATLIGPGVPSQVLSQEHSLRLRTAVLGVCVPGVVAVAVIGIPGAGTDVGGALTLTVALAVLAMALAGVRLSWRHLGMAGAGGVVVVGALGVVDYLTGPRTHMGRFVAGLGDGSALTTLTRKASAVAAPFLSGPVMLGAVVVGAGAVGALVWWVRRELRAWREGTSAYRPLVETGATSAAGASGEEAAGPGAASPESTAGTAGTEGTGSTTAPAFAPSASLLPVWFGPVLVSIGVLAAVETVVNDSGLSMPALTLAVTGPLLMAIACARLLDGPSSMWGDWTSSTGDVGAPAAPGAAAPDADDATGASAVG